MCLVVECKQTKWLVGIQRHGMVDTELASNQSEEGRNEHFSSWKKCLGGKWDLTGHKYRTQIIGYN